MSSFLKLPSPPLPPHLQALQAAARRQEPGSGYSANLRPLRKRLSAADLPNPYLISPGQPCPDNEILFQGFEWHVPADGQHWIRLRNAIPSLAFLGVTKLWIPPACKAADGRAGNGYDVYDLWDLGEFEQKGSRRTKWGSKRELVEMAEEAERHGVRVLFDAVINHKAGGDFVERAVATKMDDKDRRREMGPSREIGAWTGFEFHGRGGQYSSMKWRKEHFTGVDYDDNGREKGVWKFQGKEWAEDVDEELGNYDFLMFADIDHRHPEVRAELFRWVKWLPTQLRLGGLRLDALKHYSLQFLRDLLFHLDSHGLRDWFIVGEYWREDSEFLAKLIDFVNHRLSLFDIQLVSNFSKISLLQERGDLRKIFDDSLCLWRPHNAVTFVTNHDTQPGQPLGTPIAPFFVPFAYALILLRANTGLPCVFYADLYGYVAQPSHPALPGLITPPCGGVVIPKMMLARKFWAYGSQYDYFDDPRCVGFTREGHPSKSGGNGLAVVMTNGWEYASKRMFVGKHHAGEMWTDLLRWCPGQVIIDENGWGIFPVGHRSVAVWVNAAADNRGAVDAYVFNIDIYKS